MKYSFKMNADDYYIGYKNKLKINKLNDYFILKTIVFAAIILLFFFLIKQNVYAYVFSIFFLIISAIMYNLKKKTIINQFYSSPILMGKHTLCLYDEGLEIINAYEKIFVPWQNIYFVKNDSRMLTILPTYRKGIFTIRKTEENKTEIEMIIAALQKHIKIEEGK